ncbi:MAG: MBOAT family protein [Oscillospiraceae bacterium]|nr:MBOAT family protein [Oscillospiraceae bacterium]
MVFSDLIFLFFFLPAVILVTKLSPRPWRNAELFLFSLLFYAWGEPVYVLLMLTVILVNYLAGLLVASFPAETRWRERRLALVLAIVLNLGILGYFKYTGFFLESLNRLVRSHFPIPEIVLPIGISFYIFQSMSYVIDVYRYQVEPQYNPLLFGTYVSLFPQLIAGPIVRYRDVADQLTAREETWGRFAYGTIRFVYGLAKKVLLANQLGVLADRMLQTETGSLSAWVGMAAYTLQIYFDFSGYSDMAIGLGRMLGFRFKENFAYPYESRSITEFWKRWHMSLSSWFREYVYIPLGGNRRGRARQYLNLLIVWALTGLWHGAAANFILWGLYYAVLLILEKQFFGKLSSRLPGFLQHILTLLIVAFGWGIFYYTDFGLFRVFAGRLFTSLPDSEETLRIAAAYLPTLLAACIAATGKPNTLLRSLRRGRFFWVEIVFLSVLFILCTAALVNQSYNPFIYFRF